MDQFTARELIDIAEYLCDALDGNRNYEKGGLYTPEEYARLIVYIDKIRKIQMKMRGIESDD